MTLKNLSTNIPFLLNQHKWKNHIKIGIVKEQIRKEKYHIELENGKQIVLENMKGYLIYQPKIIEVVQPKISRALLLYGMY